MQQEQGSGLVILDQLGGKMFIRMTGVKYLIAGHSKVTDSDDLYAYLQMTLPKNQSKANKLIVQYKANDLYDMSFLKVSKNLQVKTIEKIEDCYCEDLQSVFTEITGLYTKF
jgi:hypothetical protein